VALALTTSPAVVSGSTTTATTASFTPAASSLLVAVCCVGNPTGTTTTTTGAVTDSLGSTWTMVRRQNSSNGTGSAEVWMMDAGGAPAARTVTLTGSKAGVLLAVLVFTGAAATALQPGTTAVSPSRFRNTVTLTPLAVGSYIVGSVADSSVAYTMTAPTDSTAVGVLNDATNGGAYGAWRSTNLTSTTVSQTYGLVPVPSNESEKVGVEVLAAAGTPATAAPAGVATATGTAPAAAAATTTPTLPTAANPFSVAVDWAKTGATTGTADVTDRVRGPVAVEFGREQGTALSPMGAGLGSFDLDNQSRDYSPRNPASPVAGNVIPARPVTVTRLVGATRWTLFRGHTDDSAINPDVSAKTVALHLVDYLADLRGVPIATPLYRGIRSGTAIGYVLDAVGWTGPRDIDAGASIFPYWWEDGGDAGDALNKILASEGPPALLTVDVNGGIVFRDRHHRLVRSASLTSQATFNSSGTVEPVMVNGFSYDDGWAGIVNSVQWSVDERGSGRQAFGQVWQTDDSFTIPASQSHVVVLQASDPFLGAVTPVQDVDFTVTNGAIASVTLSRTSGGSTSVTFTATSAGASVAGMALRAYSVPVARTVQVSQSDAASVDRFQQRGVPAGGEPVWCNAVDAQAIADVYVMSRKDPLPQLDAPFMCTDSDTGKLTTLLGLDLSDRVTVVEAETVTNGPFYIERTAHNVASVLEHGIVFGVEAVPAAPASGVFVIGTSAIGGASVLGY
jgi:hypothetical protein